MYHSVLSPALSSLTLSVCAHRHFSSQRRSQLLLLEESHEKKLPTFLQIRLKVVCLWLHSSGLRHSIATATCLSFLQKRNKAFFPQKKVPEPISHLALSQLLGFTTRLTSKAHLYISACVLCVQNQQINHLFLISNGPLPSGTH